jgi:hypothetical protein
MAASTLLLLLELLSAPSLPFGLPTSALLLLAPSLPLGPPTSATTWFCRDRLLSPAVVGLLMFESPTTSISTASPFAVAAMRVTRGRVSLVHLRSVCVCVCVCVCVRACVRVCVYDTDDGAMVMEVGVVMEVVVVVVMVVVVAVVVMVMILMMMVVVVIVNSARRRRMLRGYNDPASLITQAQVKKTKHAHFRLLFSLADGLFC